MMLLVISFLVGAVLGQGFKVFVLVPSFVLAVVVAIGTGVAHADTIWSIVVMAATMVMGIQFGYLFGIGIHLIVAAVSAKLHITADSTSARHPVR